MDCAVLAIAAWGVCAAAILIGVTVYCIHQWLETLKTVERNNAVLKSHIRDYEQYATFLEGRLAMMERDE